MRLYRSIYASGKLPVGWKPARSGTIRVTVKTRGSFRSCRICPGKWKKVYSVGVDGSEVHYFRHESGQVFDVKIKELTMPQSRFPIDCLLEPLPRPSARLWIALLARELVERVKSGRTPIKTAERIIFNPDTLRFCKQTLKDKDIAWAIEYGMELEDVARLVNRREVRRACDEIDQRLDPVISRLSASTGHARVHRRAKKAS